MRNRTIRARITALAASLAIIMAGLPAGSAFAQDASSVALEQARSGEDGSSGAGATSGNTATGNAKRDSVGNGGTVTSGSAGEGGTTEPEDSEEESLPENAELLAALGILEVVAAYDLTVLEDSDIAITLLPPPPADPVPEAPSDIDTGGEGPSGVTSGDATSGEAVTGDATIEEATTGETSTISTEPGSGAAPASGSTGAAAADGVGATENGEEERDRPRRTEVDGTEAPGG
jgi:hypothetical protein